jgi:hypothetical protein
MTKFAIGCLVQWYEIQIIKEYISSVKAAVSNYGRENVILDFTFIEGQDLEEFDGTEEEFDHLVDTFYLELDSLVKEGYNVRNIVKYNSTYSIANYRRDFNEKYCELVDVLIWGESDMLAPKYMFNVLDQLHQSDATPTKYLGFFGGCKMWDASWKQLEHPDFTDKPFIEGDTTNWWSLRYTMSEKEMDDINDKTEYPEVVIQSPHKFNGCGLVISSEVIKSGVNIPKGMFFVHEDTAFMMMTQKVLGNIPQYVIRNILLVHNRKHHSKRYRVKGEAGIDPTNTGLLREQHDWYKKAYEASSENLANLFNVNYKFKNWKDVI